MTPVRYPDGGLRYPWRRSRMQHGGLWSPVGQTQHSLSYRAAIHAINLLTPPPRGGYDHTIRCCVIWRRLCRRHQLRTQWTVQLHAARQLRSSHDDSAIRPAVHSDLDSTVGMLGREGRGSEQLSGSRGRRATPGRMFSKLYMGLLFRWGPERLLWLWATRVPRPTSSELLRCWDRSSVCPSVRPSVWDALELSKQTIVYGICLHDLTVTGQRSGSVVKETAWTYYWQPLSSWFVM